MTQAFGVSSGFRRQTFAEEAILARERPAAQRRRDQSNNAARHANRYPDRRMPRAHLEISPSRSRCPRWVRAGVVLCGLALWSLQAVSAAGGAPLRLQEIGLMLRSGYSSADVLQDIESRHVVDTLDAATEQTLRDAGADQRLIDALKSGRYNLDSDAAAQEKARQAAAAERLQLDREAGQDRLLAQARAQAQEAVSRKMANLLRGKLVIWKDGQLQPYDENVLTTKKIFLLYYTASWCAPGREFTPWLIGFYRQFLATHPDFEVIYVSDDRSETEMADYMKESGMPWPALDFGKTPQEQELTRYGGPQIPSLALLNGAGGLYSYSYDGTAYLGPRHVISDLAKMFNLQIKGDIHDPPPVSASQPPVSKGVGDRVTLSGQVQP
jgi:nucleoredoxin